MYTRVVKLCLLRYGTAQLFWVLAEWRTSRSNMLRRLATMMIGKSRLLF